MSHPPAWLAAMDLVDERVGLLADRQHGVVSRPQVQRLGMTDEQAERRLASGRWDSPQAGVYRMVGAPTTWRQALMAACLAAGEEALASHRAAAVLWGLDGVWGEPLELTVPYARSPVPTGAIVHRSQRRSDLDVARRDGVPVTSVDRTLIDLGAVLPPVAVELAVEDAARRMLVTLAYLRWRLDELGGRGRRGAGVLRAILDARGAGGLAGSALEVLFLRLLRSAGLPLPVRQHEIELRGGAVRVDFAFPRLRIAIELDGYRWHSGRGALQRDDERQNALVAAGWTVLRFTWDDVVGRPDYVLSFFRALRVA